MFNDHRPYISEAFAILIGSLCWYFGNGLNGNYWWLVWIAPYPLISYSLFHSGRKPFFVCFTACLLGRLSWLAYLVSVVGLLPAFIFSITLALVYAAIINWSARLVKMYAKAWTVFAYPVLFTAFEFLVSRISPDGTAGSLAYTQSNKLFIIQFASITGITGISFLISLLPSAAAVSHWLMYHKRKYGMALIPALAIILGVVIFSLLRIPQGFDGSTISVGLVSLEEQYHDMSAKPDSAKSLATVDRYLAHVANLADAGAKIVVLPERAVFIKATNEVVVMEKFKHIAVEKKVFIIAGYTNQKTGIERNSAFAIDNEGKTVADYDKTHLVQGLERRFTPGAGLGTFQIGEADVGLPICKDLDFPQDIRRYGKEHTALLTVPAWDFEKDDWLHSRMAVLRAVENGFSMVRAARQGRLTINDQYGRILNEASTAKGLHAELVDIVPMNHLNTFYVRYGDWFGWLNALTALLFLALIGVGLRTGRQAIPPKQV
jgi:apolipoprotein N-acyltransferase